jgi:hypothetical protein
MTTKKTTTTQKKKRKSPRHIFRFKIANDDTKCIESKAIVRQAKKAVQLVLKAEDVRRSMELGGVGNTMTCSMAVCAKRQEDAFPHPVEGYIDWQYRTAYVVTKLNPDTHLPSECVVYEHSDEIAKLNDSKGGQRKLLEKLEQNGDRVIRLRPQRKPKPGRESGKRTGERTSRPAAVGARLRFAMAKLGGF